MILVYKKKIPFQFIFFSFIFEIVSLLLILDLKGFFPVNKRHIIIPQLQISLKQENYPLKVYGDI